MRKLQSQGVHHTTLVGAVAGYTHAEVLMEAHKLRAPKDPYQLQARE